MAGFPDKEYIKWAKKFMQAGYKVAICGEQSSALAHAMKGGKGIVTRSLEKIFTPGSLSGEFLVGDLSAYVESMHAVCASCGYRQAQG